MKNKRNYTLKIFHGQKVERYETHSIIRFLRKTRTIKWLDSMVKVYVKVYYGMDKDVFDRKSHFYNDGTYTNKKDFDFALNAFLEGEVISK